jgi:hypothetical protein
MTPKYDHEREQDRLDLEHTDASVERPENGQRFAATGFDEGEMGSFRSNRANPFGRSAAKRQRKGPGPKRRGNKNRTRSGGPLRIGKSTVQEAGRLQCKWGITSSHSLRPKD